MWRSWRHVANASLVVPQSPGYAVGVAGPLRAGGELVKLGVVVGAASYVQAYLGFSLSASGSASLANLQGGTSLIHRAVFHTTLGVPVIRLRLNQIYMTSFDLPMAVGVSHGGMYVVFGMYAAVSGSSFITVSAVVEGPPVIVPVQVVGRPGAGGEAGE